MSSFLVRRIARWWSVMVLVVFIVMRERYCSVSAFMVRPQVSIPCTRSGGGCIVGRTCDVVVLSRRKSTSSSSMTTRLYSSKQAAKAASTAAAQGAAELASNATIRRPSTSTMIAWILAFLLLRSWWKDVPTWLRQLLLMPYRRLVRNPFRRLRSKLFQKTKQKDDTAGADASRREKALSKTNYFGDDKDSADMDDDVDFDDDDDDSSTKVLRKLQSAMRLAQAATDSVAFESFQMEAALLVMLQMVDQSKKTTGFLWDEFYESSGEPLETAVDKYISNSNSTDPSMWVLEDFMPGTSSSSDDVDVVDKDTTISSKRTKEAISTWIDQLHLADWAYLEETADIRLKLAEQEVNSTDSSADNAPCYDWHMLRHVKTNEPGRVGHYIALDRKQKVALISVKGTSDVADMITDACGLSVRYNLTTAFNEVSLDGTTTSRNTTRTMACHEGILDASLALAEDIQPLIEDLFLPAGYKVLLVGHSLGAGVACMVGNLLRARLPLLCERQVNPLSSLPFLGDANKKGSDKFRMALPLEVVAFAPPPILNLEEAVATSDFTTSIVNNDDMIPRTSISNLVSLIRFLAIVDKRLDEKGLRPTGAVGALQLATKALTGRLSTNTNTIDSDKQDGTEATTKDAVDDDDGDDVIMTGQEIFDGLNEAREDSATTNYREQVMDDMDHLFVPGKVVIVYEKHAIDDEDDEQDCATVATSPGTSAIEQEMDKQEDDDYSDGETKGKGGKQQITDALSKMNTMLSDLLYKSNGDEEEEEEEVICAGAIVADGAAPVLRHINLNRRMISDHMPVAYEKTLRALMEERR